MSGHAQFGHKPVPPVASAVHVIHEPPTPHHSWFARCFFGTIPLTVADCLRYEPGEWVGDGFRLDHRRRQLRVWIANGTYGMEVRGGGVSWGGVTAISAFGLSPGHWLMRHAANKWAVYKALGASGPPQTPKDTMWRVRLAHLVVCLVLGVLTMSIGLIGHHSLWALPMMLLGLAGCVYQMAHVESMHDQIKSLKTRLYMATGQRT